MFSNNASRSMLSSAVSRTIAGIVASPACLGRPPAALPHHELVPGPPACAGIARTTIGCIRPNSRMECTSSASASSSNTCLGWRGLRSIADGSISR